MYKALAYLKRNIHIILLISIIAFFLLSELSPSLSAPDITGDEAVDATTALSFIKNTYVYGAIKLYGRYFPLSGDGWKHGALESYLLAPSILLLGRNLEALRIAPVIFGTLTIVFIYLFGSIFFNPSIGVLAAALLGLNPVFTGFIKRGCALGFTFTFFSLSSLLWFLKYNQTQKNIYFILGMFLLGLGYNVKGSFIWFNIALFMSVLFLYSNKIPKIRTFCLGIASFCFGALPYLVFCFSTNLLNRLSLTNFKPNPLKSFFEFMYIRFLQLNYIFAGEQQYGMRNVTFFPSQKYSSIVFLFWGIILFILYKIIRKRTVLPHKKIFFIFIFVVAFFINTLFTFTRHWYGHLFFLMPYILLLIGIGIWELHKESNKSVQCFAVSICILIFGFYLWRNICDTQKLREAYNNGEYSIKSLSTWLLENNFYDAYLCDYNTHNGCIFFSDQKVSNRSFCLWRDDPVSEIIKLARPGTVLVLVKNSQPSIKPVDLEIAFEKINMRLEI